MATTSKIDIGATNITTLGTIATGLWGGTIWTLAQGGTNASLTAANGGIAYSTASAIAIKSATATANQLLLSGNAAVPIWGVPAWPSTIATNQILIVAATSVVSALAISASSSLVADVNKIPTWVPMTNGQLIIGSTGVAPVAATITAGNGISVVNGAGTTTINQTIPTNANSNAITMTAGAIYLVNNGSSLITFTLPSSPVAGDQYEIIGGSSGGWMVAQNASQLIGLPGGGATTTGISGSLSSNNQYDSVFIVYSEIANTFVAARVEGNIIYV